jgi:hypothetical protein
MKLYRISKKIALFASLALIYSLFSCNLQQKLQKTVDGITYSKLTKNLKPPLDSLFNSIAGSMLMGIADSSHKALDTIFKNLNGNVDPELRKLIHAVNTIGDTTNFQINKIGDSVHWQIGRISGDIKSISKTVDKLVANIKNQVKDLPGILVANALDTLQSKKSRAKMDSIMSHLLDSNTKAKVRDLISSAMKPTLDSLSKDADRLVQKDVPFIKKQAIGLIVAIGIVVIIIIAFVWYERRRYARLTQILTYEIDKMPEGNGDAYDNLTHRIKKHAQDENLEPLLRKILVKQGIN